MEKVKFLVLYLSITIAAAVIIYLLYTDVHPFGGIKFNNDVKTIVARGDSILNRLNIDLPKKIVTEDINVNSQLLRQLQSEHGLSHANELLRDMTSAYFWQISWKKPEQVEIMVGGGERQNREKKSPSIVEMKFDLKGNLVQFKREFPDSLTYETIEEAEAKVTAENFLGELSPLVHFRKSLMEAQDKVQKAYSEYEAEFEFISAESTPKKGGLERVFTWQAISQVTKNQQTLKVALLGNNISEYELTEKADDKYSVKESNYYEMFSGIIAVILIAVGIIMTAIRRIRAYEIGFKIALAAGILYSLAFVGYYFFEITSIREWEIIIPMVLGALALGGITVLVWAVSESMSRDTWKEKFITIDLLYNGHIVNSKLSHSILQDVSSGLLLLALWLIIMKLFAAISPVTIIYGNSEYYKFFTLTNPAAALTIMVFFKKFFLLVVVLLFVFAWLRKRISRDWAFVVIGGIVWGILSGGEIKPTEMSFIIESLFGMLVVIVLLRTDILSAIIAVLVFYLWSFGFSFLTADNAAYLYSGYFLSTLFLLIFFVYGISIFTKDKISDYDSITPVFAKHISERERMHRELEIAREVQMSFLPQKDPQFNGLQIASCCIPAAEVGGDYYDFIKLNDQRFGLIIGDVSGKGTQAAFYMTLTKGFLHALVKASDSPAQVLAKMNELFYENVDRGTFISMIYAVFDTIEKTCTIARAGHNPVIVRSSGLSKIEFVMPAGLALGLESGELFNQIIREVKIKLNPDDTLVFYTDGFTEAVNKSGDEYGGERLASAINSNAQFSAEIILKNLVSDIKQFIGRAYQHDDMTMVVVKII